MMRIACLAALALAGCAHTGSTVKQDLPSRAAVPVAVGCVSGERPAAVAPLKERFDGAAWRALTPKQKTAEVAAQALRHQSRAQALDAATSSCR
jgi:hypothetical protein